MYLKDVHPENVYLKDVHPENVYLKDVHPKNVYLGRRSSKKRVSRRRKHINKLKGGSDFLLPTDDKKRLINFVQKFATDLVRWDEKERKKEAEAEWTLRGTDPDHPHYDPVFYDIVNFDFDEMLRQWRRENVEEGRRCRPPSETSMG